MIAIGIHTKQGTGEYISFTDTDGVSHRDVQIVHLAEKGVSEYGSEVWYKVCNGDVTEKRQDTYKKKIMLCPICEWVSLNREIIDKIREENDKYYT